MVLSLTSAVAEPGGPYLKEVLDSRLADLPPQFCRPISDYWKKDTDRVLKMCIFDLLDSKE